MATKKAVAKNAAVPAKKSAPSKAPVGTKAPVQKMTKTQVIRYMAEQMEAPPKQIAAFFDLLIETATTQTREFTIPRLGRLVGRSVRPGWAGTRQRARPSRLSPRRPGCSDSASPLRMPWSRPKHSGTVDFNLTIRIDLG